MPDHIHIFLGYNLNQTIPQLVEKIKTSSNHWIADKKLTRFRFYWQKGYGAFTHSHSQVDVVAKYVLSQNKHHQKKSFRKEYIEMLNDFQITYKDEYTFTFFDDVNGWG